MPHLLEKALHNHAALIVHSLSLSILLIIVLATTVYGGERQDVRIRAGLDLFPSLLAADIEIENKKSPDGTLLLVMIYKTDRDKASAWADHLAKIHRIRNLPIRVEILDDKSLVKLKKRSPAGIFLTQPLSHTLDEILAYAQAREIIVFSPFEGDVERGVLGGVHISDRLLPYLNMATLRSSHVRIKSFFLRVSMQYAK